MELYIYAKDDANKYDSSRCISVNRTNFEELFLISSKRGAKIFLASFVIGYDARENVERSIQIPRRHRVEKGGKWRDQLDGIPTCTHSILSGPKAIYSGISIDYRIP